MKNISELDVEQEPAPGVQQRRRVKIVKVERASCKEARQAAFIKSVANLPMDEAVSRAKLMANVNSSEFRIVRMPG